MKPDNVISLPGIFGRRELENPWGPGCRQHRPRPHVSGDFCMRKFYYVDTKISASTRSGYESYTTVHTYPIRIRTSQKISQQVLIRWRQRVQKYKDTSVHTYPDTQRIVYRNFHSGERIQKSPDTPSVYGGHMWTIGVSAQKDLRIQKSPDTCGRGHRSKRRVWATGGKR